MGYVEKIMGDNEYGVYRTHQHVIVLLGRIAGWGFALLVFLGLGLALFQLPSDRDRWYIGLIALGSVFLPVYVIVSRWLQGSRGREFVKQIWRSALAGLLILIVALVIMFRPDIRDMGWVAVLIALLPLAESIRILLDWRNERYIITNRRVMEIKGTINKHVRDSALEKVNDVDLKQSVVGRLLGYGTVQIITGSDIGVNKFHRISNPVRFKRAMLNAKEALHDADDLDFDKEGLGLEETGQTIPDLIEELADLYQRGIISEAEFQAKKEELLARL